MRILKKTLKILSILLLSIILFILTYAHVTSPRLPDGAVETIKKTLSEPLPELVTGETGYANSNGVKIWYESIMPEDSIKGTILLIMGITSDALFWPKKFLEGLSASGYQVIRFDNRDTGMSDWLKEPYSIRDLANDGIAVLNSLQIQKAHLLGVSMGGMIAQQIAIDYPERAQSLISAMSSVHIMDPELPGIPKSLVLDFMRLAIKYGLIGSEKKYAKLQVASRRVLMGDKGYPLDIQEITQQVMYNMRRRNGFNKMATSRQQNAIMNGGSRFEQLSKLQMPALVIHGKSDPIIPFQHGKKTARVIPGADSLWIDGMGHDLPNVFTKQIVNKIIQHLTRER